MKNTAFTVAEVLSRPLSDQNIYLYTKKAKDWDERLHSNTNFLFWRTQGRWIKVYPKIKQIMARY